MWPGEVFGCLIREDKALRYYTKLKDTYDREVLSVTLRKNDALYIFSLVIVLSRMRIVLENSQRRVFSKNSIRECGILVKLISVFYVLYFCTEAKVKS